ncbi:MAG: hypothetical protein CMP14_09690 [Rickettsiales bacterium]|nr:hypothetical protein [Rickettsiales bacterium]
MHDLASLDNRGLPGCSIATVEFKPGAIAQSKALGFAPAIVWVPHPIQNRTPDELIEVAGGAMTGILSSIQPSAA